MWNEVLIDQGFTQVDKHVFVKQDSTVVIDDEKLFVPMSISSSIMLNLCQMKDSDDVIEQVHVFKKTGCEPLLFAADEDFLKVLSGGLDYLGFEVFNYIDQDTTKWFLTKYHATMIIFGLSSDGKLFIAADELSYLMLNNLMMWFPTATFSSIDVLLGKTLCGDPIVSIH